MSPGNRNLPTAVLIDGSAMYFAARQLFPDASIDYRAFFALLVEQFGRNCRYAGDAPLVMPGQDSRWIFWTAFSSNNTGQIRFLDMLEERFSLEVRRFAPRDSRVVEGLGDALSDRLTRFDASIAFVAGRLAASHRVIVVSDGFALAEPLVRAARVRFDAAGESAPFAPNAVTFFGRSLDPRWHGVVRGFEQLPVRPIMALDLDDFADRIVGVQEKGERNWFEPERRPAT